MGLDDRDAAGLNGQELVHLDEHRSSSESSAHDIQASNSAVRARRGKVVDPFAAPSSYDARDTYPGQLRCATFQSLDQSDCDSCYAFGVVSSYSARVCMRNRNSLGNIVISPQQIIDCNGGCGGSDEISVFESLVARPPVELWCDPYTARPKACGSPACNNSRTFPALDGALRVVGGATPAGLRWMMLEVLRGGPGTLTFTVFNDLFWYVSGVYTVSPEATYAGTHAVGLYGWGVDPVGGPYWLIQNSWGADFGEGGYFRIRRGTDESGIERNGLIVPVPAPLAQCLSSKCPDRAVTLGDCTCRCLDGFTGPACDVCPLVCANGGDRGDTCTTCACPLGCRGPTCAWGVRLGPLASCAGTAAAAVQANASFGDGLPPVTQSSFLGFFTLDQYNPYSALSAAYFCGGSYRASVNGGLCPPAAVQLSLTPPTDPGRYKIVLVPFVPADPAIYGMNGWWVPCPIASLGAASPRASCPARAKSAVDRESARPRARSSRVLVSFGSRPFAPPCVAPALAGSSAARGQDRPRPRPPRQLPRAAPPTAHAAQKTRNPSLPEDRSWMPLSAGR